MAGNGLQTYLHMVGPGGVPAGRTREGRGKATERRRDWRAVTGVVGPQALSEEKVEVLVLALGVLVEGHLRYELHQNAGHLPERTETQFLGLGGICGALCCCKCGGEGVAQRH